MFGTEYEKEVTVPFEVVGKAVVVCVKVLVSALDVENEVLVSEVVTDSLV